MMVVVMMSMNNMCVTFKNRTRKREKAYSILLQWVLIHQQHLCSPPFCNKRKQLYTKKTRTI